MLLLLRHHHRHLTMRGASASLFQASELLLLLVDLRRPSPVVCELAHRLARDLRVAPVRALNCTANVLLVFFWGGSVLLLLLLLRLVSWLVAGVQLLV